MKRLLNSDDIVERAARRARRWLIIKLVVLAVLAAVGCAAFGEEMMGEWKAQLSLRVRQDLRRELEAWAEGERRKLGNLGEVLLEWAFEQLRAAGSTDRLLKTKIPARKKP